MNFIPTILEGACIIEPSFNKDDRGLFMRTYCKKEFQNLGFSGDWVQMNHSISFKKGTVRGMHFQIQPYGEVKLVRCIVGSVFDVIVDLRKGSETFLQWTSVELSSQNKRMIFIPKGFAHGFQTLEENCELIYHHSEFYSHEAEDGIMYNDPAIGINWPIEVTVVSERDKNHKLINKEFKGI